MTTITHQFRQPNPAAERGSSFRGPMRLADLVYGPWAIIPEHLVELQAIYETHLRGEKIDIAAIEARLGRPLANEQRQYEVIDGVAVLPVQGVISPKANLMTQISGGSSSQMLVKQVLAAGDDPRVQSIILAIDSPGGNVLGLYELNDAVRQVAAVKPTVAHSDGTMASAAYLIGSAANSVMVSGPAVDVGSIGIAMAHRDVSVAEAKAGVKTTHITAGKYKRIGNPNEPLSDEGLAHLQSKADYHYGLFVDAVAANRGASVEAVLEHMADGRVFIGQQAIDRGLVDGVSTLDALIEQMAGDPGKFAGRRKARIATSSGRRSSGAGAAAEEQALVAVSTDSTTPQPGAPMPGETTTTIPAALTRDILQRDNPTLHAEILAAGASAERDRVKAVRGQLVPGHEKLIEALVADGKSTAADAAMAIVAATNQTLAAAEAAHKGDAPKAAPNAPAGDDKPKKTKAEWTAEAKAYATKHGISFMAALKAIGYED